MKNKTKNVKFDTKKIIIYVLAFIFVFTFCFAIKSSEEKNKELASKNKNASSSAIAYSYSTKTPTSNQNVAVKVQLTGVKNKYYKVFFYKNGTLSSNGNCTKITSTPFTNSGITLLAETGITKKLKTVIYSNSSCSTTYTSKESESISWSGSSSSSDSISVSFKGLKTSLTSGTTAKFSHTITGAKGKYQKTQVLTNGSVTHTDSCIAIKVDPYTETDTLSSSSSNRQLRVNIYSDKNCKTLVKKVDSSKVTWSSSKDSTSIAINFSYSKTTYSVGTTAKFSHTITGAKGYYEVTRSYTGDNLTQTDKCIAISANPYTETDYLSSSTSNRYMTVTVYKDKSCKTAVTSAKSVAFNWSSDVSISYGSFDPANPYNDQNSYLPFTIANAKGKYYKIHSAQVGGTGTWDSSCISITSNSYSNKHKFTAESGKTKYLTLTVYSDSKCSKKVTSLKSNTVAWNRGTVSPTPSTMEEKTYLGSTYYVLKSYNTQKSKFSDQKGHTGQCTWYARREARLMYDGTDKGIHTNYGSSQYGLEKAISGCVNGELSQTNYYGFIVNKLKEGKPSVIYVHYSGGNHNLTVIGVKKSDYISEKYNTDSLLLLDPWQTSPLCTLDYSTHRCPFSSSYTPTVSDDYGKCMIEYFK